MVKDHIRQMTKTSLFRFVEDTSALVGWPLWFILDLQSISHCISSSDVNSQSVSVVIEEPETKHAFGAQYKHFSQSVMDLEIYVNVSFCVSKIKPFVLEAVLQSFRHLKPRAAVQRLIKQLFGICFQVFGSQIQILGFV